VNEIRIDPVTGEWALFADHRYDRPDIPPPEFCPFCPPGTGSYPSEIPRTVYDVVVFDNQFPSLVAAPAPPGIAESDLYRVLWRRGAAEVVVYSADHTATLRHLPLERVRHILDVWCDRYLELGSRTEVEYVLIFENRRAPGGATIEHPHAQIYGYPAIPPRVRQELDACRAHIDRTGACLYCDIAVRESADGVRVVGESPGFVAVVPFCARWPFEVHVLARRHARDLVGLTDPERGDLAELLRRVLTAYDDLFGMPLPYVMAVHQAPTDSQDWEAVSHFHIELMPTQRTPDRHKVMAGSELGAGVFVSEMRPEEAAKRLRATLIRRD
jgi:UDPglucose--hexose-1-phosphate uridylyltransferase